MCVQVGGPTLADSNTIPVGSKGMLLEQAPSGLLSLVGLNGGSGTESDPAVIAAFLTSYNSEAQVGTPLVDSYFTGVTTCNIP